MKPVLRHDKVSIGGVHKIKAGHARYLPVLRRPPFDKVTIVEKLVSSQLRNTRALRVFLPARYGENSAKRYPVSNGASMKPSTAWRPEA
jgi:hypothetical protein